MWRKHGLSHAGGNALAVIEGTGAPMTPGEIGAAMHITSGSITSLVDTLVKLGLVDRSPHPEDRRKVQVSLLPAGAEILDTALPEVLQVVKALFASMHVDDRRQLLGLLAAADESISAADLTDLPPAVRVRPMRA
ncbi:MAG: MarR family transcriptional regulator [Acidimicrobiales bacterium]